MDVDEQSKISWVIQGFSVKLYEGEKGKQSQFTEDIGKPAHQPGTINCDSESVSFPAKSSEDRKNCGVHKKTLGSK